MPDYDKVGLLALRHGKILLCRKKHSTPALILPGGCKEPGESAMECLARELREELGDVQVSEPEYIGVYSDRAAGSEPESPKTVQIELYRADLIGERLPDPKSPSWSGSARGRPRPVSAEYSKQDPSRSASTRDFALAVADRATSGQCASMRSMSLNRRNLLQSVGLGSLGGFWPLSKLAAARPTASVYQQLGVRPVINCMGAWTVIGASRQWPELHAPMAEASSQFVFIEELQEKLARGFQSSLAPRQPW